MEDKIVTYVGKILQELGVDLTDQNFLETPWRVAKMLRYFFRDDKDKVVLDVEKKVFPTTNDQIVLIKGIECFGMCPHHLLPIRYRVAIGYVPNKKVLGLSKLPRLAMAVCSYPKLQEDATREIADVIEKLIGQKGIMVIMWGEHGCMRCRGIEMKAEVVTSECRGIFREDGNAKDEFLKLLGS